MRPYEQRGTILESFLQYNSPRQLFQPFFLVAHRAARESFRLRL
jgi:hypothetical protein